MAHGGRKWWFDRHGTARRRTDRTGWNWNAPAWFRRKYEAKRRAKYRCLMQRQQYDDVPRKYHPDVRWNWW